MVISWKSVFNLSGATWCGQFLNNVVIFHRNTGLLGVVDDAITKWRNAKGWKDPEQNPLHNTIEWFSYDLEMKTREQNRNNKIERIHSDMFGLSNRHARSIWFVKWTLGWKELSRNQPILRFDVILQHDWPIEQCPLHIRVFFGGKTKSPCFDLFIHWLMKQITNTYRNHFLRSYENRST